jgi:hypothetical protein
MSILKKRLLSLHRMPCCGYKTDNGATTAVNHNNVYYVYKNTAPRIVTALSLLQYTAYQPDTSSSQIYIKQELLKVITMNCKRCS